METRKRVGRSKRLDTIREQRRRQKRRQQLATILTIGGAVVLVVAVIVLLSVKKNMAPVGAITSITPEPRPMANGNEMGDPNAPIEIVEFSDFQCPACLRFYQDIEPSLVTEYISTGKVHFTYRSMGLWIGSESVAAAQAAYCAADQDRFWDYHDILFANWTGENVGDFTNNRLIAFAETIGLDMNTFRSCFNGHKYSDKVNQDYSDGIKAGVQGTPSILINGAMYNGDLSYTSVKQAIDAALAGK
jgi:protein-disulfide isomerase